jgi:hypothetical protein
VRAKDDTQRQPKELEVALAQFWLLARSFEILVN